MQKILIIEDEAELREMLVTALQMHGFETIEAQNGRAGVRLAGVYLPDLILSDIRMEGFDGFAALAAIRYQPLTATIPVILMTGQPDEQGRRFAMEMGADDYLPKPFTIPALVATIHVQLKKQAAIKQQALSHSAELEPASEKEAHKTVSTDGAVVEPVSESFESIVATPRATAHVATGISDASQLHAGSPIEDIGALIETYLRILNAFHPNVGNTAMRTVALCRALAEQTGMAADDAQNLCCAAALSDISLVGLDREAVGRWLRNPRKVTEDEHAFLMRHPIESQRMLEHLPMFEAAGEIIRSHHENWDGTGYPSGLNADQIAWLARLLAAALFYCNHHTLGPSAVKSLKSQAGRMFDPAAVEAVVHTASLTDLPRGVREILLNEMKPGQTIAKDIYNCSGLPLVRNGRELTEPLIARIMAINRVTPIDQFVLVYC